MLEVGSSTDYLVSKNDLRNKDAILKNASMLLSNDNRIVCFDFLRVVSCLFVILLHVSASFVVQMENYPLEFKMNSWNWGNAIDSMTRSAVPLFVMLSGSFMLDTDRYIDNRLILKKVKGLVAVFLFWSVLYYFVTTLGQAIVKGHHPSLTIKSIVSSIVAGSYHMWFLYLIVSLYILTPLLRLITKEASYSWYFLLLSLVVTFVMPLVNFKLWDRTDFSFVKGFSFYYVLGIQLKRFFSKHKISNLLLLTAITVFLCSWFTCLYFTWKINLGCTVFRSRYYGNMTIYTMLEAVSIFVITCCIGQRIVLSSTISFVARHCMGIYLSHVLGINIVSVLVKTIGMFSTPVYILLVSLIVFAGCFFVTFIMTKMHFFKKMVYM